MRETTENWGNVLILPTQGWEAGYGPEEFKQIAPEDFITDVNLH